MPAPTGRREAERFAVSSHRFVRLLRQQRIASGKCSISGQASFCEHYACSPAEKRHQFRIRHRALLSRGNLAGPGVDDIEGRRADGPVCIQELPVLRLVEIEFEPDKLSSVPAEIGVSQHVSHQVAGRSPGRPALDEERRIALERFVTSFGEIVLDEGKACGPGRQRGKGKASERDQVRWYHSALGPS